MHDEGTDSRVKIFANIFISFIGAGILGLPYAFREVGKTIDTCRLLEYFNNHMMIRLSMNTSPMTGQMDLLAVLIV